MRVTTSGAVDIAAGRESVWAALHDPARIAPCIPGCRAVSPLGGGRFALEARVRFGPVRIGFDGIVEIADFETPARLALTGRGGAGRAGGASGTAEIGLVERADGTCRLTYTVAAEASGPIAKLGPAMLGGIAAALADLFGRRFAATLDARSQLAGRNARTRPITSRS